MTLTTLMFATAFFIQTLAFGGNPECTRFINKKLGEVHSPVMLDTDGRAAQVANSGQIISKQEFKPAGPKAGAHFVYTFGSKPYEVTITQPSEKVAVGWSGAKKIKIKNGDSLYEIQTNSPDSIPCEIETIKMSFPGATREFTAYDNYLCNDVKGIKAPKEDIALKAFRAAYRRYHRYNRDVSGGVLGVYSSNAEDNSVTSVEKIGLKLPTSGQLASVQTQCRSFETLFNQPAIEAKAHGP